MLDSPSCSWEWITVLNSLIHYFHNYLTGNLVQSTRGNCIVVVSICQARGININSIVTYRSSLDLSLCVIVDAICIRIYQRATEIRSTLTLSESTILSHRSDISTHTNGEFLCRDSQLTLHDIVCLGSQSVCGKVALTCYYQFLTILNTLQVRSICCVFINEGIIRRGQCIDVFCINSISYRESWLDVLIVVSILCLLHSRISCCLCEGHSNTLSSCESLRVNGICHILVSTREVTLVCEMQLSGIVTCISSKTCQLIVCLGKRLATNSQRRECRLLCGTVVLRSCAQCESKRSSSGVNSQLTNVEGCCNLT